ncbi:MAG: TetR/AcrR family transcriptional regulator [Actinomycetota bacterium]|nr:TetR/AcrR family transcriptional regulator [Actinomycetota bacterium]
MTSTEPARALRADARQNREKLLAAAAELFAASGVEVSLQVVADRAGVGIGTLYRHFPTRDALVEATYRNEVERLCDAAGELRRTRPPDVALAEWMDRFVTYVAAKRGMADALQSITASNSELYPRTRTQLLEAITSLLEHGTASGAIRADVEPEDVLRAMNAVWLVTDEHDWQERARRLLRLLMDGLRYGAGSR